MLVEVCVGVASLVLLLYVWLTWNYGYWKNAGVPYFEPSLVFGNLKDMILMRQTVGLVYHDIYKKFPDSPAVGIFSMRQPQLLIRDAELMKTVLIKEFNSFHDNAFTVDSKIDPIVANNPFVMTGEKWKVARAIHTPALTTVKLKGMLPLMINVTKDMVDFLNRNIDTPLDAKYFAGQYTTDVVASCIFGLVTNSFKNSEAPFRKMSAKLFSQDDITVNLAFMLTTLAPTLASLLRLRLIPKEVSDFFANVIKEAYEYRKKTGEQRNDFLQQLINDNTKNDKPIYSDDQVTAYTMTFFFDGYETSSILISYILYQLAIYPEIQQKLRDELRTAFADSDSIDFEVLQNLPYLDAVINETLRMYPPGTVLTKKCTKDITLRHEGQEYPMKKGFTVAMPLYSVHVDPKYHEDPSTFDPERFCQKSGAARVFFPFGVGPRACLGQRFALTQTKVAISALLLNFQVLPRDAQFKKIEFDPLSTIFLLPKGGLWIKFRKLKV